MRATFKTTKDLLTQLQQFHANLSGFYDRLSNEVERPRVRLLLEFISRNTKHLEESLAKYQQEASDKVLDTWFQYLPELNSLDGNFELELHPRMSVDEAVEIVLSYMDKLASVYHHLAERTPNEQVSQLFSQLLKYNEEEKRQFMTDVAMMRDL